MEVSPIAEVDSWRLSVDVYTTGGRHGCPSDLLRSSL
jgi:hypothetical protein